MEKLFKRKLIVVAFSSLAFGSMAGCDLVTRDNSHVYDKEKKEDEKTQILSVQNYVVGPVTGASITLANARSNKVSTENSGIKSDKQGKFDFKKLDSLEDSEYYLVTASQGNLQDSNGDGKSNKANQPVRGEIYALAKGENLKKAGINVSLLSNIAWEYVKNNYSNFSDEDIERRLSDIAQVLFLTDITNDGVIDNQDILAFNPEDKAHLDALALNYQYLFKKQDDGLSFVDSYLEGNVEEMVSMLDNIFSNKMTRYPSKDPRSNQVKIEVLPFGKGSFSTADNKIQYTSDGRVQKLSHFYTKGSEMITVTAIPDTDTEILNWSGCDIVSEDKTQCQVKADKNHQIVPAFGYKEAKTVDSLVDLSLAKVSLENNIVYVTLDHYDDDLLEKMQILKKNDYIVGAAEQGFLRKVSGIEKINEYEYKLETVEASMDEVILQGTAFVSQQITPKDVPESLFGDNNSDEQMRAVGGQARHSGHVPFTGQLVMNGPKFSDIEGVELVKPISPDETEFTVRLGMTEENGIHHARNNQQEISFSKSAEVTLYENKEKNVSVKAKGEVKFSLKNTFGMSYGWGGIEGVSDILEVSSNEDLTVTVEGEYKKVDKKFKLGTISRPIVYWVGLLPVYMDHRIDIYVGLDGKISASVTTGTTLEQKLRVGFTWNKNIGFQGMNDFSYDNKFLWPNEAKFSAELQPYFLIDSRILFYGYPGVSFPKQFYVNAKAEMNLKANNDNDFNFFKGGLVCTGGVDVTASLGGVVKTKFVFGSDEKQHNPISSKINDIFQSLNLELLRVDIPFYKNNFGGTCEEAKSPAKLSLTGGFVNKTVTKGELVTQEYIISNTGGKPLDWRINYIPDGIISVSKSSGSLDNGKQDKVTITIDTGKINEFTTYRKNLEFINHSESAKSKLIGDFHWLDTLITGTTSRSIEVTSLPDILEIDKPNIISSDLVKPTTAKIVWDYPEYSRFKNKIDGFNIYVKDLDSESEWQIFDTVYDIKKKMVLIPDLLPNHHYQIAVNAQIQKTYSDPTVIDLYVPFTGTANGSIVDAVTRTAIANAKVTIFSQSGDQLRVLSSDMSGQYSIDLPKGNYIFQVDALGYLSEKINVEILEGGVTTVTQLKQIPEDKNGKGFARGYITDATSDLKVTDAIINVRKGLNTTDGKIVKTLKTDSNGNYTVSLPAGNYTLEVIKEGYAKGYKNILVLGSQDNPNQNATLSPQFGDGEIRIVLSWGDSPSDLDSHLWTPNISGNGHHIYFSNTGSNSDIPYVTLDRDDTNGEGPETITINRKYSGTYYYSIYNYSGSPDIKTSQAIVKVYNGNQKIREYNIPLSGQGRFWNVFKFDGNTGKIIPINNISDVPASEQPVNSYRHNYYPTKQDYQKLWSK